MKLYFHPASATSLAVLQLCAEEGIAYEPVLVDILAGEQAQPAFLCLNPWGLVPVLVDGDLVLTESSAILKYLADKVGSSLYPNDPTIRARVHQQMDVFNTQVYRELAFHLVYPQVFAHHRRDGVEAQHVTVSWGLERTESALEVLDRHVLRGTAYLCGDEATIADVFAASLIDVGSLVGCDYGRYPHLSTWLDRMKARPKWAEVHEVFDGLSDSFAGQDFVRIGAPAAGSTDKGAAHA